MNKKKRCANPACRCLFIPNPRIKNQRYCNRKDCQRVRKRLWQRRKMKNDLDYKKNQRDSHKTWREQNPDYWKDYRQRHPEYVKMNRQLQKARDKKRRRQALAKMDALKNGSPVKAGETKGDALKILSLLPYRLLFQHAEYPLLP